MNLEPRVSCALHNSLPRAKDKKRQKWLEHNVQAIFQSLRVQQVAPTSLYKGGKKVYLFYSARFSHFIDSLKPLQKKWLFYVNKLLTPIDIKRKWIII